ncbi:MAG: homoserine dehydrogenase [Candidatus Wallbacteria bacterium]|nr:homoserine dehydrogenase [Candidatus Wallbacteria bacterium]
MRELGVGLIGCGVVGAEVVRGIAEDREVWARRYGVVPVVRRVAVRDTSKRRECKLPLSVLTAHPEDVLADPSVDVVVEATGRVEEARNWMERALDAGKHVVTASKAVLARHMGELLERARSRGLSFGYEATVAGGIPLLRALREGLVAYGITEVAGILNGTTHYMLTRMEQERLPFETALSEAQRAGFAEPDPSEDVSGEDAACKLAVVSRMALALPVTQRDVYKEGIRDVKPRDLRLAVKLGFRVKPMAVARRSAVEGKWELRVHPALVPIESPLGRLALEENGIRVTTERRGDYFFSGRGAGGAPTAGAVLSDLLEVALRPGGPPAVEMADSASTVSSEQFVTGHYVRVAGDAARLRKDLEERDIQVIAAHQEGQEVALVTGRGTPASVLPALAAASGEAPRVWLRVEGDISA